MDAEAWFVLSNCISVSRVLLGWRETSLLYNFRSLLCCCNTCDGVPVLDHDAALSRLQKQASKWSSAVQIQTVPAVALWQKNQVEHSKGQSHQAYFCPHAFLSPAVPAAHQLNVALKWSFFYKESYSWFDNPFIVPLVKITTQQFNV